MPAGAAAQLRAIREGKTPPKKKKPGKPANSVQAVVPKKSHLAKPKKTGKISAALLAKQKKLSAGDQARFRKAIERKTPLARPTKKPRKVAKKRAAENRIYKKVADDYLATHTVCQIRSPVCTGRATVINHKAGRRGKRLFDVSKFEPSCPPCNGYVEEHPELDNYAHKEQHNTEKAKR